MVDSKQLALRKRISSFYENYKQLRKTFTVNHFKLETVNKTLVYQVINLVDDNISSDNNFSFWSDLASSHYARDILADFERLNIEIVPKHSNPQNVPQSRPIERF